MLDLSQPVLETGSAVAEQIDRLLAHMFHAETARWIRVDRALADPVQALARLVLSGGKRLRPLFTYLTYTGAGGSNEDLVINAGAALELMHTAALIHDDVMDRSLMRRGEPSTHHHFTLKHQGQDWQGDSARFGDSAAVVIGDLSLFYAGLLLASAPAQARLVFDEAGIETSMGQYLELLQSARGSRELQLSWVVTRYKAAKYSVERPMHLGAALAGRLPDLKDQLSAAGLLLGEAFQLKDDLLGAFGDPVQTGKRVGEDFREGRWSVLLAIAAERSIDGDQSLLGRVGARDLDASEITGLQRLLISTGAKEAVEITCEQLVDRALAVIGSLPLTAPARDGLAALARYVCRRTA